MFDCTELLAPQNVVNICPPLLRSPEILCDVHSFASLHFWSLSPGFLPDDLSTPPGLPYGTTASFCRSRIVQSVVSTPRIRRVPLRRVLPKYPLDHANT